MKKQFDRLMDLALRQSDEIERLCAALRPFAQYADSMQTLTDLQKVGGLEVCYFRNAAKVLNAQSAASHADNKEGK